jgi:hypothetical protein
MSDKKKTIHYNQREFVFSWDSSRIQCITVLYISYSYTMMNQTSLYRLVCPQERNDRLII